MFGNIYIKVWDVTYSVKSAEWISLRTFYYSALLLCNEERHLQSFTEEYQISMTPHVTTC